ncbi:hypothetical protein SETIT_8G198000v2 [Setaria italica]|uniref:BTB domain-containing protein n=1 Tax=Setaria italica TaxID=4555 RepID=K3ZP10_SETIT|nr:hypothetical protein SETIT_8G198000v2 [Setaria italica]
MPSSPGPAIVDPGRSNASTIAADMETGSHELTVRGYSGTKGLGVGKGILSAAFSIGGHSCSDCISLYLQLLVDDDQGDNGDVKAQFKFCLLDQGEPVPSYTLTSKRQEFARIKSHAWGWAKFIRRKELEESPHIEDDTFRISCHVTVPKIRAEETQVHFLTSPSKTDLHRHLRDLLESNVGADVKFRVGRETFTAHRSILAARSPVFRAELFGWMKEKWAAQVRIDDMEPRVFGAMLHFIYTDSLPQIEGDRRVMAQHLLVAADRYCLVGLKMICEDMLRNFIDTNTAATTLELAEQQGCRRLKERCLNFLKNPGNTIAVMATDGFEHLMSSYPSLVKDLLAKVSP